MRYMSRSGLYQASNVTFNPNNITAISYSWWTFVAVIDGKVVFNNYNYSNTTNKHQWKVRRQMRELGINIDLELPVPKGLQVHTTLETVILEAEEYLCEAFITEKLKAQDRYHRAKERKAAYEDSQKSVSTSQDTSFVPVELKLLQGGYPF